LNSSEKLYFEIVNDLRWTKVFYCFNGLKIYLGANCYEEIINGLSKGLFTKKIPKVYSVKAINNKVKTKIIEYKNKKIYWILNLMDPHFSIYRTYKTDILKILFLDCDNNFIKEIDIDKKYLKFE
jgi:hypothetical protein